MYSVCDGLYLIVTPKEPSGTVSASRVSCWMGCLSCVLYSWTGCRRASPSCCPARGRLAGAFARLPPLPVRPAGSVRVRHRRRPRAYWHAPGLDWPAAGGHSPQSLTLAAAAARTRTRATKAAFRWRWRATRHLIEHVELLGCSNQYCRPHCGLSQRRRWVFVRCAKVLQLPI